MENIIDEKSSLLEEEPYQKYITESISNLKKNPDIKISSKILHSSETPSLYYYCTVKKQTKSNPFDVDILICFEFIDKEIPYVTILTDFMDPSLNDNRNYYRCLIKENDYKFDLNKIEDHKKILESMIDGIENFLLYIKESIEVNSFIYFGEYEIDHIYQINDFLQCKNYLNFYRLNEVKNKNKEKYILFTKLYFLLFEPLEKEKDKTLVKLIYYQQLRDMYLSFDKNERINTLILKLSSDDIFFEIEFVLIDRKKKIIEEEKDEEDEENKEKEIKAKKTDEEIKNEIKENIRLNYALLIKEWFTYIDNINFKTKYENVVNLYQMLFNDYRGRLKIKSKDKDTLEEYNKLIAFYEKIVIYYENKKEVNNNERLHKIISNIIYICSELINYAKKLNKNGNEYLLKAKKYLNFYK